MISKFDFEDFINLLDVEDGKLCLTDANREHATRALQQGLVRFETKKISAGRGQVARQFYVERTMIIRIE